mgnify:CR=1 FL=1
MQHSNITPTAIPCNSSNISFNGGAGRYVAESIVLGTGIGPVTASFNAENIPDRFYLEWSGSIVADSLFVGDGLKNPASYTSSVSTISAVTSLTEYNYQYSTNTWATGSATPVSYTTASIAPYSLDGPTGELLRSNTSVEGGFNVNPNGRGNWGAQKGVQNDFNSTAASCVEGNVLIKFFKHTSEPSSFNLIIDGVGGTAWNLFSITCPSGTTLNSSSIFRTSTPTTVYHTAPSYDLNVGMTLYTNTALTTKFNGGGNDYNIYSGSLPTNPPSTGDMRQICFDGEYIADSGSWYSKLTINTNGVIEDRYCQFPA